MAKRSAPKIRIAPPSVPLKVPPIVHKPVILKPAEGPMVRHVTIFYDREANRIVRTEPAGFEHCTQLMAGGRVLVTPIMTSLHPANFGDVIQWSLETADGEYKA